MSKERTYTQAGYDALLKEREALDVLIEKNKKDISTARSFGDLSENSEYTEAKEEQTKLAYRKAELDEMIKNAVIVDADETDATVVGIGSFVTVENLTKNKEQTYHIVGSYEANPFEGKISDQSPIGQALIGKRAGEKTEATLPNGNTVTLLVKDVYRA